MLMGCDPFYMKFSVAFIGLTICAKMIGGGRPLLRENLARTDPPAFKTLIFNLFSPVAPQP